MSEDAAVAMPGVQGTTAAIEAITRGHTDCGCAHDRGEAPELRLRLGATEARAKRLQKSLDRALSVRAPRQAASKTETEAAAAAESVSAEREHLRLELARVTRERNAANKSLMRGGAFAGLVLEYSACVARLVAAGHELPNNDPAIADLHKALLKDVDDMRAGAADP